MNGGGKLFVLRHGIQKIFIKDMLTWTLLPSFSMSSSELHHKNRGWRSMIACMGFGNLFNQIGLLPPLANSSSSDTSVPFSISTVSGSSWYSLQLFYSQQVGVCV